MAREPATKARQTEEAPESCGTGPVIDRAMAEVQAEFCRMMGNPHRLMILYALRGQERCVSEICDLMETSQPAVSQHLAAMRKLGILLTRRQGQNVYYRLADPNISAACDMIRSILQKNIQSRSQVFAPGGGD